MRVRVLWSYPNLKKFISKHCYNTPQFFSISWLKTPTLDQDVPQKFYNKWTGQSTEVWTKLSVIPIISNQDNMLTKVGRQSESLIRKMLIKKLLISNFIYTFFVLSLWNWVYFILTAYVNLHYPHFKCSVAPCGPCLLPWTMYVGPRVSVTSDYWYTAYDS